MGRIRIQNPNPESISLVGGGVCISHADKGRSLEDWWPAERCRPHLARWQWSALRRVAIILADSQNRLLWSFGLRWLAIWVRKHNTWRTIGERLAWRERRTVSFRSSGSFCNRDSNWSTLSASVAAFTWRKHRWRQVFDPASGFNRKTN